MHALRYYREEALREQKFRCLYCKAPLETKMATADHKHPKSRRGRISKENIAAACPTCNQVKGELFAPQFFFLLKKSKPPKNVSTEILLIWASRRIWKRTQRACERIERISR